RRRARSGARSSRGRARPSSPGTRSRSTWTSPATRRRAPRRTASSSSSSRGSRLWGEPGRPGSPRRGLRRQLRQPEAVPGRVAESRVDAVGLLGRLLAELDAAPLELLVGALAVVCREEEAPFGALREQAEDLLAGLLLEDGRAGHGHERDG